MSIILPARNIISLLGDIKQGVAKGNVNTSSVAQETTLQQLVDKTMPRVTMDAFSRQRVSEVYTVFESKQLVDANPTQWENQTTGTGSVVYNPTLASSTLTVAAPGDRVISQTYRRFNYQPGMSQLIFMTGVLREPGVFPDGDRVYHGQFGDSSGVFITYENVAGLAFGIRKNTVDTLFPQATWNLDRMDGSGPSGITIDPTKIQIIVFNYEWLGAGSVWFGFFINGWLYFCHRADNANVTSEVYMETPDNPLRVQIVAGATGGGSTTRVCACVNSEGGTNPVGNTYSMTRTTQARINPADTNPEKILMAFRYKSVKAADIEVDSELITALATGGTNDSAVVCLRLLRDVATQTRNEADTGPAVFTWSAIQDSVLEVARPVEAVDEAFIVTDNFLGTSGYILSMHSLVGRSRSQVNAANTLKMGISIAGVSDVLVVTAFPFDTCDVNATFDWKER